MFRNAAEIQRIALGHENERRHRRPEQMRQRQIKPKSHEVSTAAALLGPNIVLVGDTRATDEVHNKLRLVTKSVRKITTLNELVNVPIGAVDCVVIAGPIESYHIVELVEDLMDMGLTKPVPVFMVLPHWTDEETTRTLYELGVRFIFEWPTEKDSFPFMVRNLLNIDPDPGQLESRGEALKKALELRIRVLDRKAHEGVDVHVYNRTAILEGEIYSQEKRDWLKRELERVPGINQVSVSNVSVR